MVHTCKSYLAQLIFDYLMCSSWPRAVPASARSWINSSTTTWMPQCWRTERARPWASWRPTRRSCIWDASWPSWIAGCWTSRSTMSSARSGRRSSTVWAWPTLFSRQYSGWIATRRNVEPTMMVSYLRWVPRQPPCYGHPFWNSFFRFLTFVFLLWKGSERDFVFCLP